MLFNMLSLSGTHTAYPVIVQTNLFGYALEICATPEGMGLRKGQIRERVGCAEATEHEEIFSVTFVLFFVSTIVFAEGKGGHAWKRIDLCRDR